MFAIKVSLVFLALVQLLTIVALVKTQGRVSNFRRIYDQALLNVRTTLRDEMHSIRGNAWDALQRVTAFAKMEGFEWGVKETPTTRQEEGFIRVEEAAKQRQAAAELDLLKLQAHVRAHDSLAQRMYGNSAAAMYGAQNQGGFIPICEK